MDYFFKSIWTFNWKEQQDAYRSIDDANNWLIEKNPEYRTEILAYYGRWEEMLSGQINGSVKILEKT
jgi:2-haloacid dehalogenase